MRHPLTKEEKKFLQQVRNSAPEPYHTAFDKFYFRWPPKPPDVRELIEPKKYDPTIGIEDDFLHKILYQVSGCYTFLAWTYDGKHPLFYEIEP